MNFIRFAKDASYMNLFLALTNKKTDPPTAYKEFLKSLLINNFHYFSIATTFVSAR